MKLMRTYLDGEPYYCVKCGLGYWEYCACEEVDCELESIEAAQKRRDVKVIKEIRNLRKFKIR